MSLFNTPFARAMVLSYVNAFLSKIEDIRVEPRNEIMISFDVFFLFTSIPLDTARQITKNLLNNTSWQTMTQLNTQDILI